MSLFKKWYPDQKINTDEIFFVSVNPPILPLRILPVALEELQLWAVKFLEKAEVTFLVHLDSECQRQEQK